MTKCDLSLLISASLTNTYRLFPCMCGLILKLDSGKNVRQSVPTAMYLERKTASPLHNNYFQFNYTGLWPGWSDLSGRTVLGRGYIGARSDTTQQSGQTPDNAVEIKHITVYVSGYIETDQTGMLSPRTVCRQQSEFVSSRQSGQIPAAVCVGFECCCNGENLSNRTC